MNEQFPEVKEAELPESERMPAQQAAAVPRQHERRGYRSLFWPIVLIGVGTIWLLNSMGVVSPEGLSVLWRLWPLGLIVLGLDLLIGRYSPVLGSLIGLLAVAAVVLLVIIGPSLGLASDTRVFGLPLQLGDAGSIQRDTLTAPLQEETRSAEVSLDLSWQPSDIHTLPEGAAELFHADISYFGVYQFSDRVSGGVQQISLSTTGSGTFIPWGSIDARWDIALNPTVPVDLTVDVGAGSADLDLAGLALTGLDVEGGAGSTEITLPGGDYEGVFNVGAGSFHVSFSQPADARLEFEGGAGSLSITVPEGAAVRFIVEDGGAGSVSIPSGFSQVDEGDEDRDTGTWETAGFDESDVQMIITIRDVGAGSVTLNR